MRKKTTPNRIAVIAARGLGDGLLSMILSHNLSLEGHDVTTFSSPLCQLKRWFPGKRIEPFPVVEAYWGLFSQFDQLIVADHAILKKAHDFGNELIILEEDDFDKSRSMVDNLVSVCRYRLGLHFCLKENGITPPEGLKKRKMHRRVVVHPMSGHPRKNWPPEKFYALCEQLLEEGYEPALCMSPDEQTPWSKLLGGTKILFPHFATIDDLACYVYESGYMIGNDSGVGHLASCLGIPTLSIFARKSYSKLWRPGWGDGEVITPPNILIGSHLRQKYWKHLLSVKNTLNRFKKMTGGGS